MKRIIALGLMGLGALTVAQAQEADKFKVYGFIDAAATKIDIHNGYATQIFGRMIDTDTLGFKLTHANLYFDMTPNQYTKALIEVNLAPGLSVKESSIRQGSDPAIIRVNGAAMTDVQLKAIITGAVTQGAMQKVDAAVRANPALAGAPEAMIQGVIAQKMTTQTVQDGISSTVDGQMAKIAQLRNSENDTLLTNHSPINLERAYFDLLINDYINVRIGKWITPSGIWNVDHASPVVLTVSQPYQTTYTAVFPEAQTGIMTYGRYYLGDHDLSYNAWLSSGRSGASQNISTLSTVKNNLDNLGDISVGGHLGLHLDILKSINFGVTAQTGSLKHKYRTNTLDVELTDLQNLSISDYKLVDEYQAKDREHILGGDARVELGKAFIQGEINHNSIDNDVTAKTMTIMAYYGLIGYKFPVTTNILLTPYAMFESYSYENSINSPGMGLSGFGVKGFESYLLGLNLALYSNVRVKAEYNLVRLLSSDDESGQYTGYLPMGFKKGDLDCHISSIQFSLAF